MVLIWPIYGLTWKHQWSGSYGYPMVRTFDYFLSTELIWKETRILPTVSVVVYGKETAIYIQLNIFL